MLLFLRSPGFSSDIHWRLKPKNSSFEGLKTFAKWVSVARRCLTKILTVFCLGDDDPPLRSHRPVECLGVPPRSWQPMTDHEAKPEHRLAAIMATDVVGYSRLMQADEAGALAALAAIREATQNQIGQHRGRIANTAGDSVLAAFGSAVEAVSCAIGLQQELATDGQTTGLQVRIGIHLGDVVDKEGDLFGTAVNVAARLESIAQPGSIVVAAAVRDAIAGKLPASFTDL